MVTSGVVFKLAIGVSTAFFVIGTPVLLHFLCKRYVSHMYYNSETKTFTAVRMNFFARQTEFSFTPRDITPSIPSPLSNFQVGEQAFLLDQDVIRETHPQAYIALMRYDEPLDLSEFVDKKKSESNE